MRPTCHSVRDSVTLGEGLKVLSLAACLLPLVVAWPARTSARSVSPFFLSLTAVVSVGVTVPHCVCSWKLGENSLPSSHHIQIMTNPTLEHFLLCSFCMFPKPKQGLLVLSSLDWSALL